MTLVRPSASDMPPVPAVRVSPTCTVPLMVGAPVATELVFTSSGPGIVTVAWFTSGELRSVHTAEFRVQSVVGGRRTVTSLSSVGSMVSSHRMLGWSPFGLVRRTPVTSPLVTVNTLFWTSLQLRLGSVLKYISTVKVESSPSWLAGTLSNAPCSGGGAWM